MRGTLKGSTYTHRPCSKDRKGTCSYSALTVWLQKDLLIYSACLLCADPVLRTRTHSWQMIKALWPECTQGSLENQVESGEWNREWREGGIILEGSAKLRPLGRGIPWRLSLQPFPDADESLNSLPLLPHPPHKEPFVKLWEHSSCHGASAVGAAVILAHPMLLSG